ncbi:hypothetical protein CHS0354_026682 [Potamilus streckersoni]|uniref:Uncharacterized protein n=1 Tax=Potamilus streckersoni TaxID=2493646 RepID=A0AAE0VS31_9BIVA|nr:hypothetical protein CHS0354_026682 [Potamilus streckersoni]
MPFQAGEKIRADSGQEVPLQPRKKNIFNPTTAGEKKSPDCGQEVPLPAEKKNILRWEKFVHFQMNTIFRKFPFQEDEKKMGQSTEMSFQAGEKIRADSGQEVPLQPKKKNIFNPTTGGNKLFSFRCAQYYENATFNSARRSWTIVPKYPFKRVHNI